MLNKLRKKLIVNHFKSKGITIPDDEVNIHASFNFDKGNLAPKAGKIIINKSCTITKGVVIQSHGGTVSIDHNTFIGEYVVIYGHGGVTIGANTLIAMHTCIVSSNHTIPAQNELIRNKPDILLPVKIGSDVWIGAGCKILGGVTIGNGCVVGAGSVVTRDLPPYSVSVGNPAKIIKYRKLTHE